VQTLTIALQTSEADRVRAQSEARALGPAKNNWAKLKGAIQTVRAERDAAVRGQANAERERDAALEMLRELRNRLEQATRARLDAERLAGDALLAAAKRDAAEQMRDVGMSPAKSLDEQMQPGSAPPAPTQLERGMENEPEERQQEEEERQASMSPIAGPAPNNNNHHGNIALSDAAILRRGAAPEMASPPAAVQPLSSPPALEERTGRDGSQGKKQRSGAQAPLVMLTSYGDQQGLKLRLTRKVEALGGAVYVGKDFSDCVTHVVSPAAAQPTVKVSESCGFESALTRTTDSGWSAVPKVVFVRRMDQRIGGSGTLFGRARLRHAQRVWRQAV
jgi:hypothetical protein